MATTPIYVYIYIFVCLCVCVYVQFIYAREPLLKGKAQYN